MGELLKVVEIQGRDKICWLAWVFPEKVHIPLIPYLNLRENPDEPPLTTDEIPLSDLAAVTMDSYQSIPTMVLTRSPASFTYAWLAPWSDAPVKEEPVDRSDAIDWINAIWSEQGPLSPRLDLAYIEEVSGVFAALRLKWGSWEDRIALIHWASETSHRDGILANA